MTGRGVDQILPHPSDPALREPCVRDAREYVELAEQVNGPIPRPVDPAYVWGDALQELERMAPAVRIMNLETSVTTSDAYGPEKAIHYRMHPRNLGCLARASPDVCVLANNHVLDYGEAGLLETLDVLEATGLTTVGAGRDLAGARRPAIVPTGDNRRVIVIAVCDQSSGVPRGWSATPARAGVDLLPDLSDATADALASRVQHIKQPGDIAVVSVHWGSNWGYTVPELHVRFARRLVDGGADVVYGHSSHHPRPIEVYKGRLLLYGCGDFLDDYEGISGYEQFRDDLVLMYFAAFDAGSGELAELRMTPLRIRQLRLTHASLDDARWLRSTLDSVCGGYGSRVEIEADGQLRLRWP